MKRIRSNRGGLYPSDKSVQAGHKSVNFEHICNKCKGKILKNDSEMTIPGKGDFHWDCKPRRMAMRNGR